MSAQLVITFHHWPEPSMEITVGDQSATLPIAEAIDRLEAALRRAEMTGETP